MSSAPTNSVEPVEYLYHEDGVEIFHLYIFSHDAFEAITAEVWEAEYTPHSDPLRRFAECQLSGDVWEGVVAAHDPVEVRTMLNQIIAAPGFGGSFANPVVTWEGISADPKENPWCHTVVGLDARNGERQVWITYIIQDVRW